MYIIFPFWREFLTLALREHFFLYGCCLSFWLKGQFEFHGLLFWRRRIHQLDRLLGKAWLELATHAKPTTKEITKAEPWLESRPLLLLPVLGTFGCGRSYALHEIAARYCALQQSGARH